MNHEQYSNILRNRIVEEQKGVNEIYSEYSTKSNILQKSTVITKTNRSSN